MKHLKEFLGMVRVTEFSKALGYRFPNSLYWEIANGLRAKNKVLYIKALTAYRDAADKAIKEVRGK